MTRNLPGYRAVAAALRMTTERLVREIAEPQRFAPGWDQFEWAVARAVCAMHGISGLLAARLRWRGPESWRDFLRQQRAETASQFARAGQLLAKLDQLLGNAGIPFVALKGSAIRTLQLHEPGDRPQADIDLLVHPDDLARAGAALSLIDYELILSKRREVTYAPKQCTVADALGEHPANPLKIELHARVSEELPVEAVDITSSLFPSRVKPGANPYASLAALMRHTCLHAAGSMRVNAMRFLQIWEIAQLARRLSDADWRELVGEGRGIRQSWWLYPPLAIAARYVPGSVSAQWLAALRKVCPLRLRRRYARVRVYDVSWSNLRIAALPGHEWSRNPLQVLRLARNRVWPSRVAREELDAFLRTTPQLTQLRWYGVSHLERIARWTFTRPPRVQTISAVSLALRETAP